MGREFSVAEDILQETFLAAYLAAGTFRRESTAKSWLFGIASKKAAKWERGSTRRGKREEAWVETLEGQGAVLDIHLQLERQESAQALRSAISKLTERSRSVYLLCGIGGVCGSDAAGALQVKLGTVHSCFHEAKRRLRKLLDGEP